MAELIKLEQWVEIWSCYFCPCPQTRLVLSACLSICLTIWEETLIL